MGSQDGAVARQVEVLRRDGTVVGRFSSSEEAAAWRAIMRRACRAAGLRIRTGLANADGRIAWVYHVDHVLTEAENRVARRAIDAAYNDEPRVPFHQMVREEQRKMLQVVRDDETRIAGQGVRALMTGECCGVTCSSWWPVRRGGCPYHAQGMRTTAVRGR